MTDKIENLGGRKRKPGSVVGLESLGRERRSRHFFMRDFLYSEIGNFHQIQNLPDDPSLALHTGRKLATELLEPLVETFGPIAVRSAYRSPAVNGYGAVTQSWMRFERRQPGRTHLGSA